MADQPMADRPMPRPKKPDPALPNEAGRLPQWKTCSPVPRPECVGWLGRKLGHSFRQAVDQDDEAIGVICRRCGYIVTAQQESGQP